MRHRLVPVVVLQRLDVELHGVFRGAFGATGGVVVRLHEGEEVQRVEGGL